MSKTSSNLKPICIIPARSGSKRIKNKNIINFNGKPLIYYSIETAIKSKLFSKVIVSTDSSLFTVSFGVNQASSMWMTDEGAANQYDVYAIGSGPFSTFMTVE